MSNELKNNPIDVRTFASMQEIQSLPGFIEDNPINNENYHRIIGDYDFQDEVKCCMEIQDDTLCAQEHKHGFVAELKDKSITIIGNICAQKKFNAEASIRKALTN